MSHAINRQWNHREWWVMACYSTLLHVAVYFFVLNFHFSAPRKEAPTYYVDVVNLPVANPQAGTPSGEKGSPTPAPPPPVATQPQEMALPSKPVQKVPATKQAPAVPPKPSEPAETEQEFEKRMERLEQEAGARHTADALSAFKKGSSGKGPAGMPGASGTEAGSDYASFIHSRLQDAFRREDTFKPGPGKKVIVRLTIDRKGRVISQHYEQRSNDWMFDAAVVRAITRAEREFKSPPSGGEFESRFIFKPQGVDKK